MVTTFLMHVRRSLGDDRGASRGHDLRDLGFGCERGNGEGRRRHAKAGEEGDLVAHDQFLGQPLGVIGNGAVILDDDLDLPAGDSTAVLRLVEPDRRGNLLAGRLLRAGHGQDESDLDGLGSGIAGRKGAERECGKAHHHVSC
jgi:hypothetical protein